MSRTFFRTFFAVACLAGDSLFASFAAAQTANAVKPVAVVAFSGYDELMKDVDFIGTLGGKEKLSGMVEGFLMLATEGKGLDGLQKDQPIGAIILHDGANFAGGLCLPVTDLQKLIAVGKGSGVTSEDAGDGVTKISAAGQTLFAKTSGKWAMLSMAPQMLEGMPADPGAEFAKLTKTYDLAVSVHVQNVPEEYQQQWLELVAQGAQQGLSQQDGESDADYAERKKQMDLGMEELKKSIKQFDKAMFGLAVDSDEQRAFLDYGFTAVPGTKLAEGFAAYVKSTTNFAGFIDPDAAMTANFAVKAPQPADDVQLQQMKSSLTLYKAKINKSIDDEDEIKLDETKQALKEAASEVIDAVADTIATGVVDGGAVLNLDADSASFVVGGYVVDPAKIEAAVKKIAAAVKKEQPDMPEIAWASAKHGDVTFHTLSIPVPSDEEEARQFLGDDLEVALGVGKQAVYFAVGRDCVEKASAVIDESAKSPNKPVAPMEMNFALGPIMAAAKSVTAANDKAPPHVKETIDMVAEQLTTQASGRDHIRLVATPMPNGVRTRFEAEEGVLRAIGTAVMASQMQPAGAAGQ